MNEHVQLLLAAVSVALAVLQVECGLPLRAMELEVVAAGAEGARGFASVVEDSSCLLLSGYTVGIDPCMLVLLAQTAQGHQTEHQQRRHYQPVLVSADLVV